MTVLLDTNILISAALFPNGVVSQAYSKAIKKPYKAVVCEWSIKELYKVFNRKFPNKIYALEKYLLNASSSFQIIETPTETVKGEEKIRDPKDRPLFRAAIIANVDILLTGDLDFLDANIEHPSVLTNQARIPLSQITNQEKCV